MWLCIELNTWGTATVILFNINDLVVVYQLFSSIDILYDFVAPFIDSPARLKRNKHSIYFVLAYSSKLLKHHILKRTAVSIKSFPRTI